MKKKTLLLSILSIIMCLSLTVGGTFALFTSKSEVNVAVTSATVSVKAVVEKSEYSFDSRLTEVSNCTHVINEDGGLDINYMMPGDTITATVSIENKSDVAIKYKVNTTVTGDLADYLLITPAVKGWTLIDAEKPIESQTVVITLPYEEEDPKAQGAGATITITVEAVQANAEVYDDWNGTASIAWYDPENTEHTLSSAEDFAGFASLVDGSYSGARSLTLPVTFEGQTVKLDGNVDLESYDEKGNRVSFEPIGGIDKGTYFQGTFDGQGNTVKNLFQSGWDLGKVNGQTNGMGLFGWTYNSTIKNLNIDNAVVSMESVVMGGVAGYSTGDCTFEDINVTNTQIANYNWDTGGIVGQVYGSGNTFTFKNITIDETNTISGHWGTWDVSAGGVIGRTADGVNVVMENITIACVLDVYNDVCAAYQWYAYRYSGMLVGYTKTTETLETGRVVATAPHVKCTNVTVIYDDWANYTYCQASNVAPQYVRVQGGYSTDPYYSGRHWTAGVDANGNKMVDDNHVHKEGEAHNELIVFDQLFGGGQGVYGTATHDGVTVIYNNK